MNDKIALFIDGANLHAAARTLGFDVDFGRLLAEYEKQGSLVRAYFYTAISDEGDFSNIRPLVDWLEYNGFTVRTKPVREFDDGEGRRRFKRNVTVELAVDVLEIAPHINRAIIFSGDGDLRALIAAIQRRGVHATVVSSLLTAPPMIADDLRRQADTFLELDSIRSLIARPLLVAGERRPGSRAKN
jgi:uncharacterized LabA/DUF88 family protein